MVGEGGCYLGWPRTHSMGFAFPLASQLRDEELSIQNPRRIRQNPTDQRQSVLWSKDQERGRPAGQSTFRQ